MIYSLDLHRFKQFSDTSIQFLPSGLTVLAGENNSGKSSILQAMSIWEFCKTVLEYEKGRESLNSGVSVQGLGVSDDEFIPLAVPSLKHLWTNLRTQKDKEPDGYTLKLNVSWDSGGKHLEIGLSVVNDRLFIKPIQSNLCDGDVIPRVAYLPPFAGIRDKESKETPATRQRLIGQGLSGSILRNLLLDLYLKNQDERKRLKGTKTKISSSDLDVLRKKDPWEVLNSAMRGLFGRELKVTPFNELYHSYIRVEVTKVTQKRGRFVGIPGYNSRDIIVEGSGFLQWVSVLTLFLSPNINVVLLDEPDAHMHSQLQYETIQEMISTYNIHNKQIIVATHSPEIIKRIPFSQIMFVEDRKAKYLASEDKRTKVLHGLGSDYIPILYKVQKHKRLFFVEGEVDVRLLQIWCDILGMKWPDNLVPWVTSTGHKERKSVFLELQKQLPEIKAVSLRDRDDEKLGSVGEGLVDKSHEHGIEGFYALKWKRRHIESYLASTEAISRAAQVDTADVVKYFSDFYGLTFTSEWTNCDCPATYLDMRGKEIFIGDGQSVCSRFGIGREDIAKAMTQSDICDDVKTVLAKLVDFTSS